MNEWPDFIELAEYPGINMNDIPWRDRMADKKLSKAAHSKDAKLRKEVVLAETLNGLRNKK